LELRLQAGLDFCFLKPFIFCLDRLYCWLPATQSPMYSFETMSLDPHRRELRRDGSLINVEPQVFDLVEFLIRHRDRVVSKDELIAKVWHGRIVSDSTISVRINAARSSLGDNGGEQRLIKTYPRKGVRFVGEVHEATIRQAGAYSNLARGSQLQFSRTVDGVNIAVSSTGDGDVVVRTATWLNHLEYEWQSPIRLPLLRFLLERCNLVRYDGRGNGLSDWDVADISFEGFLRDLDAVVAALGLRRYALLGVSQGAAIAIAHAARYPERVSKLVLHGSYARGRNKRSAAREQETGEAIVALMKQGWGDERSAFMRAFSSLYLPNGSREQIGWFAELQRAATSADNAVKLRLACDEIDVSTLLSKVSCPALVLHCTDDAVVPFEEGRRVAAHLPHATFVPLESENHILLEEEPAWRVFVSNIDAFLKTGSAEQAGAGS
jgi:pimeloyl-ACP methyl ester carboxylesterase/DNA-binding winged helix-turn-helix (wHTH) protein